MSIELTSALLRGRLTRLVDEERRRAGSESVDPRAPVAIRFAGQWSGDTEIDANGVRFIVREVRSVLAFRAALHDRPADARLVLVTPLGPREIGLDAQARLAGRQLMDIEPWKVVLGLFGATTFDPRLRQPALADALLESCPPEGYPAVPGGVLDEDTAWQALARVRLGLSDVGDPAALVGWALSESHRYREAHEPVRGRLRAYLERRLAPTAGLVFDVLDGAHGDQVGVAILMCHLVERVRAADGASAERLPYLVAAMGAGRARDAEVSAAVSRAVEEVVHIQGDAVTPHAVALDRLVEQSGLGSILVHSELSPAGLRLRRLALADAVDGGDPAATWRALEHFCAHGLAVGEREEPARMLARMHAWSMSADEERSHDLGILAQHYVTDLAWLDRARHGVAMADFGSELSGAARRMVDTVRSRREAFNQHFAQILADWLPGPTPVSGAIPAEMIIDVVLQPIAAGGNALLLVLDGMSQAVAQVIVAQLEGRGWLVSSAHGAAGRPPPLAGIAPVPTVTRMARSSLIAGRLSPGGQHDERRAFVENPGLRRHCQAERPPVLLHKSDLDQDGLADSLGKISDPRRRVVGVVINAIDDELSGSRQYDRTWSIDQITPLRSVLDAAREAHRAVVVVSDHGHVWDDATRYKKAGGESERWRAGSQAEEGELVVRGPRVDAVVGEPVAVALWTEQARYTRNRHAGYHGGLTPQEVLTPLFVLWPATRAAEASGTAPVALPPHWWSRSGTEPSAARLPSEQSASRHSRPPATTSHAPPDHGQIPLFATQVVGVPDESSVLGDRMSQDKHAYSWGVALTDSHIYRQEVERLPRPPKPDHVRRLVDLLAAMDGRGACERVAEAIGMLPQRVPNLVSAVGRVINVDGFAILTYDSTEHAVRLDVELLRRQFALDIGR